MKFPENRTEIMDQVAAFAVDSELTDKEKEPRIRLALMHWNYVDDKSIPKVEYEGFDLEWTSPVSQLDMNELVNGAEDYIDQRCEELNQQLMSVSSKLYHTHQNQIGRDGNPIEGRIAGMNKLYDEKARIVSSLETFNCQIIDRSITFDCYDASILVSNSKVEDIFKEIISTDINYSIGVDMRIEDTRDGVNFTFYMNKDLVDDFLKTASVVFEDENLMAHSPSVSIQAENRALPNFKDHRDQFKMEKAKQDMEKSKDIDFNFTM
jgi:hypothetical protein